MDDITLTIIKLVYLLLWHLLTLIDVNGIIYSVFDH